MNFNYPLEIGLLGPLVLVFILIPFGASVIALGSEFIAQTGNRLADKLAQQMARMGSFLGLTVFVAVCILAFVVWKTKGLTHSFNELHFLLFRIAPGLFTGSILLLVYWGTWKKLKQNKPAHACLGAMGMGLLGLFLFIFLGSIIGRIPISEIAGIPEPGSLIYPLMLQWMFFSILAAANIGFVYLLLRRNIDDFGRDYYKYALKLCARWSLYGLILGFVPCIWTSIIIWPEFNFQPIIVPGTATLISAAFILLCSITLLKTRHPLRCKGMIALAQVFLWLLFAARMLAHLEFMNMLPEYPKTVTFSTELIKIILN